MADEMVLASQRVRPAVLEARGFAFRWSDLGQALADLVGPVEVRS
jgi:NAD dependent epimerase/dehydratase family enzyme